VEHSIYEWNGSLYDNGSSWQFPGPDGGPIIVRYK